MSLESAKLDTIRSTSRRIAYLEGEDCSIKESAEGFEEVDFLEWLRSMVYEYESSTEGDT